MLLLGMVIAEVKERVRVIENEEKREVQDSEVIEVLRKGIKKRRDSVEQYTAAHRPELAQKEADEIVQLERYLPAAVDPAVIRSAVVEVIAGGVTQMGHCGSLQGPLLRGDSAPEARFRPLPFSRAPDGSRPCTARPNPAAS